MEWNGSGRAKGEPKYATMRYNLDPLSDLFVLHVRASDEGSLSVSNIPHAIIPSVSLRPGVRR